MKIKMFFVSFILLFVLKIKYGKKPVINILCSRYGAQGVKIFRSFENYDFKLRKALCDLSFLTTCSVNNLSPKFLHFKTSLSRFHADSDYKQYQKRLLEKEIQSKRDKIVLLRNQRSQSLENLRQMSSYLDFNHFFLKVDDRNSLQISKIKLIHNKKLFKLGLKKRYDSIPPDQIIFNLSSKILTPLQEEALSLGLKFCFNPLKLNYAQYFSAFENLYKTLSFENIRNCIPNSVDYVKSNIKTIALKNYYSFKSNLSPYHKSLISSLRELSKDKNIVITKPDKGTGVVLLNKDDYLSKMNDILQDSSKFTLYDHDLYKTIIKYEDKHNRIIDQLFKDKVIDADTKNRLRSSGSRPGVMYGLPKIHKTGSPMRPILSTSGSYNYESSKFLVELLSPIIDTTFTVKDSFDFASEISSFKNQNYTMASFDVKSLFTNIPLDETCNIIINQLFPHSNSKYKSFEKSNFKKLLDICVKNNFFIFNQNLYFQKDGTPMGGCVSSTLADIFLSFHEKIWLQNCPQNFKPVLYRRYVDDTFLLFKDQSHIQNFLSYINDQHNSIKFTCEMEKNNSLSFLDVLVKKSKDKFNTESYTKPTNTGLGMKFDSAIPNIYKFNLIKCLIDRAYKINSSIVSLNSQIENLTKFFYQNNFPLKLIEKVISDQVQRNNSPNSPSLDVQKKKIFTKLPYLSSISNKNIKNEIQNLIEKFYPHIQLNIIFQNNFSIKSFFPYKDSVPTSLLSNIVYKYTCEQCDATYYGETTRHLYTRIAEHKGLSPRTGNPVTYPAFSSIRDHCLLYDHDLKNSNFSVLQKCQNSANTKISESILINRDKPSLNNMESFNLNIFS